MKKYILLSICFMMSLLSNAQTEEQLFTYGYPADSVTLRDTIYSLANNYITGEQSYTKTPTISGFGSKSHGGTYYGLLSMPANVSNTMAGCQITEIGFFPFITSQTTAKLVISKEIGGTPLYEQEVTGVESITWQKVRLTTPFTIPADEDLYIGYSIESVAGDYPVGYYYTCRIMEQTRVDPILDYVAYNVTGTVQSGLIDAQTYKASRQTANIMLYATIEPAENGTLPENAVAISTMSLSGSKYQHPGAEQTVTCTYNNTATQPLSSFKVTLKDGDEVLTEQLMKREVALDPMEEGTLTTNVPTDAVGTHRISVTISEPNGQKNAYNGVETMKQTYLVYNDSVQRNVVLEHFTTGNSVNAVPGEQLIETELAKVDPSINVIRINHHSGNGEDKLTADEDKDYLYFFGTGEKWTPAFMIDRTDFAQYGAAGYGGTATVGPVFGTKGAGISSLVTAAYIQPAFVTLNVEAKVVNGELQVKVNGNSLYELPGDSVRLNVVVVQDSLKAAQYLADGTVDKNHIHYNVFRKSLSGTWGEAPDFNGNTFEKTYTCTMPTTWKPNYLRVVAFLSDYDSTNTRNCCIYNAAMAKVGDTNIDGIEEIHNSLPTGKDRGEAFNLAGQRVNTNAHGIVIINGKKIINK